MPSGQWWKDIHERLKRADKTAPAELAEAVLPLLERHLRARHPEIRDATMLADAAVDAVMTYVKEPGKFNPEKCSLLSYLKMSALGDLLNERAKERRRRDRPTDAAVELDHFAGKELGDDTSGSADESADVVSLMIHRLFQSDQDRRLAALIVDGERSTRDFAEVLGIMDLPIAEQRKTVKQHKDRIKKVLQRRGREHYG